MEKLPDIYSGELNTKRIKEYKKLSELYYFSLGSLRDIFCRGADWYKKIIEQRTSTSKNMKNKTSKRPQDGKVGSWVRYADELENDLRVKNREMDDLRMLFDEYPIKEENIQNEQLDNKKAMEIFKEASLFLEYLRVRLSQDVTDNTQST